MTLIHVLYMYIWLRFLMSITTKVSCSSLDLHPPPPPKLVSSFLSRTDQLHIGFRCIGFFAQLKSLPLTTETLELVSVFVSLNQFRKRIKGTVAQIVVIIIIIIIIIIINYYHLFLHDVFFVGHPYLR
jgi:hypothetical protein